jgi:hypothetical protein
VEGEVVGVLVIVVGEGVEVGILLVVQPKSAIPPTLVHHSVLVFP